MFRKAGPDYPFRAACVVLLIGHFVVALAVVLLAIQFHFNQREFLTALALVEATMLLGNLISATRLRTALAGVRSVLAGEATDEESLRRAWSALVALPTRHFKLALQVCDFGARALVGRSRVRLNATNDKTKSVWNMNNKQ
jgi:hypothetical protein